MKDRNKSYIQHFISQSGECHKITVCGYVRYANREILSASQKLTINIVYKEADSVFVVDVGHVKMK